MRSLTCIICPIGCILNVENIESCDNMSVTGNRCVRGVDYALEEIRCPKRVVTATVSIMPGKGEGKIGSVRRVPVKTTIPCPREKIPALLQDIYKLKVSLPVNAGDVLIAGWGGEGIDIVTTRRVG
jgi:CxxC motif-containing protein